MHTLLLVLCLTAPSADGEASKPRKPSAIAPSLPALTREEENKLDDIISRFILADTGRLKGPEGTKAVKEFEALKSEAIPALIRGLNKAAQINHSCPVLMISKKLNTLLMASEDLILLEFARDEIGAGIGRTTHATALQNIRFNCLMRKSALARRPADPAKVLAGMSTADLVKAAGVRGPQLRGVLGELGKRDGREPLLGLMNAVRSADPQTQKLGREMLDAHLARLSPSVLIERLADSDAGVRGEARQALRKLSKGEDHGPDADATPAQQAEAQKRWRAWWAKSTSEQP